MNKTTENLWKALAEYKPPKTEPVIWKLVYNVIDGKPIDLTTENFTNNKQDISYIEISREQADQHPHLNPRARVVDKKITYLEISKSKKVEQAKKITVIPDENGNIVTDDYSMLLINSEGNHRWSHD